MLTPAAPKVLSVIGEHVHSAAMERKVDSELLWWQESLLAMERLTRLCESWGLTDPVELGSTHTSELYRVNRGEAVVVLKLLNSVGAADEAYGAVALEAYGGRGAVHLLATVADAQLIEYVDGPRMDSLVSNGKDGEATRALAGVLRQLRGAKPTGPLLPLQERFAALFHRAKAPDAPTVVKRGAHLARRLLESPQQVSVLHGDLHHENLLLSERGWLAIDPKGLLGEATFDAVVCLFNPPGHSNLVENPERVIQTAVILADILGLDRMRILQWGFAYGCLSRCWSEAAGESVDRASTIASMLEGHLKVMGSL